MRWYMDCTCYIREMLVVMYRKEEELASSLYRDDVMCYRNSTV